MPITEQTHQHAPVSKDPLARLAERQSWIEPSTELAAQETIRSVFEIFGPLAPKVRAALHGDWLHEPLHAVMTDVPVGSWTAAVLFDALGAVVRSKKLDFAADALVILGLVGATGAAITGMNDWAEVKKEAPRRIGSVHALLNVGATAFFAVSLCLRRRDSSRANARSLAILGFVLVSASAHLGGNMVYEHGIGVERGKAWPES